MTPPTPPLKLALVSRRYPPLIGGAERVLAYLAEALAREGADVSVLTSAVGEAAGLPTREALDYSKSRGGGRLTIHRLETSPLRFFGTWLYMRNLRRWLAANPVDLAYVSMLKHDAYVAVGAGRERGFPVVLRPEGAGDTGDVAWQARGNFGARIARRTRDADAFVAISKAVHDELAGAGYDAAKIHDLPNGVPIPARPWQRRKGWQEAPHAMFVGRLAPEKGLTTLVRAWPAVRSSFPNARLTLVGEGPERPALERAARDLGLPAGAVSLPGATDDVEAALRAADLFVLPSTEEGMSIALLEAMAIGVPVVATAIPGNRRLIADFKHGRLAPARDVDALARTIVEQWTTFDRAFHMSRAARGRVEQQFSIRAVARGHLQLFQELIARERSG
ncbi:glycosyltransferase family 4 protein [Planctomyces sp. SH-PL62]|uniref:glycosyltransferase family 4 protein n=1 Tax=Planctomyces sp. SH-PL62 TaxID=1636152 RepID=UPI00078BA82F|nr:glycosyltransferase family 4 protein [Planctomyces sp. SH-PL62]AMV35969.1 GDP-mannose-dependent alpha-(1-6)-phosphatidylinositol monomannoside mannosyltransferase [Planctomyces sp. SH-PL62]